MLKRLGIAVVAALLLILAGLVGWLIGASGYLLHVRSAPAPVLGKAPAYRLTNQLGQTVDSSELLGKVQVVTFLFPYCTTYCPLIAAHLVGFENALRLAGMQDRVAIVAFNVDPVGTGPAQMRAFLKEYGWNPQDTRWEYLTGEPKAVRRVVTQGFHIAYERVPANDAEPQSPEMTPQPTVVNALAQQAHVGYDITHNDGLVVVDPQGRIRRYYEQADVLSNDELLKVVKALLPRHGR